MKTTVRSKRQKVASHGWRRESEKMEKKSYRQPTPLAHFDDTCEDWSRSSSTHPILTTMFASGPTSMISID
jgi:hypothetical protein